MSNVIPFKREAKAEMVPEQSKPPEPLAITVLEGLGGAGKVPPEDRVPIACNIGALLEELELTTGDLARAGELKAIEYASSRQSVSRAVIRDPENPKPVKELAAGGKHFAAVLRAMYEAQTPKRLGLQQLANRALASTTISPLETADLTPIRDVLATLEHMAAEIAEEAGLIEAFDDMSAFIAGQHEKGSSEEPWPYLFVYDTEDEGFGNGHLVAERSRNLWIGMVDGRPVSERELWTYFKEEHILSLPRVYLGYLLDRSPTKGEDSRLLSAEDVVEPTGATDSNEWDAPHSWIVLYPRRDGRDVCPALLIKGAEWGDQLYMLDEDMLFELDRLYTPFLKPRVSLLELVEDQLEHIDNELRRTAQRDFLSLKPIRAAKRRRNARRRRAEDRARRALGHREGQPNE